MTDIVVHVLQGKSVLVGDRMGGGDGAGGRQGGHGVGEGTRQGYYHTAHADKVLYINSSPNLPCSGHFSTE